MSNAPAGTKGEIRGFMSFFGLHLITCGLYQTFWWFKVAGEVNTFLGQERMNAGKLLGLTSLTCGIYMIMWQFGEGKKILAEVQQKAGLPVNVPFFLGPWPFQQALNKVWESVPG
jgi:hypothetical protein